MKLHKLPNEPPFVAGARMKNKNKAFNLALVTQLPSRFKVWDLWSAQRCETLQRTYRKSLAENPEIGGECSWVILYPAGCRRTYPRRCARSDPRAGPARPMPSRSSSQSAQKAMQWRTEPPGAPTPPQWPRVRSTPPQWFKKPCPALAAGCH